MANGKLVLQAPLDCTPPNLEDQRALLTGLGLIGAGYGDKPGVYLVGHRFLQLITFLGCSPYLQLEPPDNRSDDFCRVEIYGPFPLPRLLSGENTRPPRCLACGKGLIQWRQLEAVWKKGGYERKIVCPSCQHSASPAELNWQRKAGFGRYFIVIRGIFPEEAVPLPALLDSLRGDGAPWRYFYLQDL